jgi:hypothetical protein
MRTKRFLAASAAVVFVLCFTIFAVGSDNIPTRNKVADVSIGSSGILWQPKVDYAGISLTVDCPDGRVFFKTFEGGVNPYFSLSDIKGQVTEGSYTYELVVRPVTEKRKRKPGDNNLIGQRLDRTIPGERLIQSGYFTVRGGSFVTPTIHESGPARPLDEVIYDDLIVDGSLCVGNDCYSGYSFGHDTIVLMENNLRIYFDDTSNTSSFPNNDWRIVINDTTDGGGAYFALQDVTDGKTPFTIEAGAKTNSLYVDDDGQVGIGTSGPVLELHIKDGDTPTIRLQQDTSYGWPEQAWDLGGNETSFFVRDGTHAARLPFRIEPETPSNTLCLKSNGYIGVGTWSPSATLEVETTGANCAIMFDRTDGATGKFTARTGEIYIGTSSNHKVVIVANNNEIMHIESGGDVGIGVSNPTHKLDITGGAYCDGGAWVPGSSREYKENIADLTLTEAKDALEKLNPVKFNYKTNKEEDYIGFIAEDVPELVATKERKGVAPMDVVAVLTKVVQEQQKMVDEQQKLNKEQQKTITELKDKIAELEKK